MMAEFGLIESLLEIDRGGESGRTCPVTVRAALDRGPCRDRRLLLTGNRLKKKRLVSVQE